MSSKMEFISSLYYKDAHDMKITKETEQLIAGYLTGSISEEELSLLKEWLEEDNLNREHFKKIEAAWILADNTTGSSSSSSSMAGWNAVKEKIYSEIQEPYIRTKQVKAWIYAGIAASWLVFFVLGVLLRGHSEKSPEVSMKTTEITSPLGAKSVVKLPDGTCVWLNAGSKLTYNQDFDKTERKVELTGEAYFSVATNKSKPFLVKTSEIIVRAVGTRFNVKAYPEEKTITTTLEEGQVDVRILKDSEGKNKILLKPKEKIVYYKNTKNMDVGNKERTPIVPDSRKNISSSAKKDIEVAVNVNTDLYTSWKDKRWIIESLPLSSLTPMLERKFNIKIIFTDKEIKNYKFTGTIENETIEQLLSAIRFTAPIDYKIHKDTISLMLNNNLKERYTRIIRPVCN